MLEVKKYCWLSSTFPVSELSFAGDTPHVFVYDKVSKILNFNKLNNITTIHAN